jgi:hypothetical protein
VWNGILAGGYAGSQVGAVAALALSLLTWFLVAFLNPSPAPIGGGVCCFFALGVPLLFGGVAGGLAGLLGGLAHALTGRPAIGALCGLGAGVLTAGILAGVWWLCFSTSPGQLWLVPAGTLLAVVIAGPCGGLADLNAIRERGQTAVAGPFRRLFGFGQRVSAEPDERWHPPVRKPDHPQGIEESEEGMQE